MTLGLKALVCLRNGLIWLQASGKGFGIFLDAKGLHAVRFPLAFGLAFRRTGFLDGKGVHLPCLHVTKQSCQGFQDISE